MKNSSAIFKKKEWDKLWEETTHIIEQNPASELINTLDEVPNLTQFMVNLWVKFLRPITES
jgi:hypothetical protein